MPGDVTFHASTVEALIKAWTTGNPRRFHTLALQCAAHMARNGDPVMAGRVRQQIDDAQRDKTYLPPYSGDHGECAKCRTFPRTVRRVYTKYMKEGDAEFMERTCSNCSYIWYERCAADKAMPEVGDVLSEVR